MRVLVTGADGFVGRWVLRALRAAGHDVVGTVQPGLSRRRSADRPALRPSRRPPAAEADAAPRDDGLSDAERDAVQWIPLELGDLGSVRQVAAHRCDAVIHLAAVASGGDALRDAGVAWAVNAAGTARLLGELGRRRAAGESDPLVLVVSTAEVYGAGPARPLTESDPLAPRSPYAASKVGAELAARETAVRTGLRVVIARSFPHTGPGQDERFVAPAFARRLRGARLAGARVVKVGNLSPVRDFLDVRDVAAAYLALLARAVPGEVYNVASGRGLPLQRLFEDLAAILEVDAIAEPDPEFMRPADIPHLVGDAGKLRGATGWEPTVPLDRTLRDLVHAQAD